MSVMQFLNQSAFSSPKSGLLIRGGVSKGGANKGG